MEGKMWMSVRRKIMEDVIDIQFVKTQKEVDYVALALLVMMALAKLVALVFNQFIIIVLLLMME